MTGKVISHNVYWLSNDGDYKSLNDMQETSVQFRVLKGEKIKTENRWTIQFTNTTNKIAFFIRPQLMVDGEEVLPSYWSGNYFTLAPDESTTVTVSCPVQKLGNGTPLLKVSGWNVIEQELGLTIKAGIN